jgi:hypothetical protein
MLPSPLEKASLGTAMFVLYLQHPRSCRARAVRVAGRGAWRDVSCRLLENSLGIVACKKQWV